MATTSLQMPHHAVLNPFQTPNSRQIPMMPIPTHIPPPPMPAGMLQWLITRGPLSRTSPTTISSTSGRSSVSSANGMLNIDLVIRFSFI
ncbi:unnamed protein product [Anisakis simplex]|uniref:Ovule protein n=1 Tax=Anisakis simplex TaxID=6269 RepID=A0A0M3JZC7_ANISI|nr:unnamed protein product [Anisakis simplex]